MKLSKVRVLTALALTLAAALVFLGLRQRDVYQFTTDQVGFSEEYTAAVQAGDTAAFAGQPISEGLSVRAVPPGRYTLELFYTRAGAGSRVQLVDPVNNQLLAEAQLDSNGESTAVPLTLDHHASVLVVRGIAGADGVLELTGGTWASDGPVYTDAFWAMGCLLVFAAAGWLLWRRYRRGSTRPLQLFVLAAVASLPFCTAHLPTGHDLHFHLSRVYGLGMALLDGQFPVRINLDFWANVGYINPILYPELFLYPSGALCALGASVLLAYKLLLVGITFATAFVAYYAMRDLLGDRPALWFAALYLLNPYRMNDLYLRAALGEALAMVFLPLVLAGLWNLMQGDCRRGFVMAGAGITGVLQSHIITTFLVVVYGGLYAAAVLLVQGRRFFADRRRPLTLLGAAGTTVALNLWFLVPFVTFSRWDLNIFHENGQLETAWVYLPQAFLESYSTGYELGTTVTQGDASLSVGAALLAGSVLFVLLRPALRQRARAVGTGCLAMGALALFLCSDWFPWQALKQLPLVYDLFSKQQFAWRGLTVVCLCLTVPAALALDHLWQNKRQGAAAVVAALACFSALNASSGYLSENWTLMTSSSSQWSRDTLNGGEYMLTGVDTGAVRQLAAQGVTPLDGGTVTQWQRQGTTVTFTYQDAAAGDRFLLPLYGYDALYKARRQEDGTAQTVARGTGQMLEVTVTEGAGTVEVRYYDPLRFRLAGLASLLTAAGLAALALRRRKKEGRSHGN